MWKNAITTWRERRERREKREEREERERERDKYFFILLREM